MDLTKLTTKVRRRELSSSELCQIILVFSESYFDKNKERPPSSILDELGDLLFYLAEREDQDREKEKAIKRTREDWLKLESLVSRDSPNQYKSLISKIDRYYELGMIDEGERTRIKKIFRKCKHFRCENAVYKGYGSIYCSAQCRNDENNAKRRARDTKTRLVMGEYVPKLTESKDREFRRHEKLILEEIIFSLAHGGDKNDSHFRRQGKRTIWR